MTNLKLVLDKRRAKSDGTFNVIFRITHLRKIFTINSGVSLGKEFWNSNKSEVKSSHPNAKSINIKLNRDYFRLQEILFNLDNNFSIDNVRSKFKNETDINEKIDFKSFSDKIISQLKNSNRIGNAIVYQTGVNRFLDFSPKNELYFEDFTYSLLEEFVSYLRTQNLKTNSISNYLRSLRAIYNRAVKEDIIDGSKYPFKNFKIRVESTKSRALPFDTFKSLLNSLNSLTEPQVTALNYFLLSYYLMGITFTDLAYLKNENIADGRVFYRRKKTHKLYNIKMVPQASQIIHLLNINKENDFLLPILCSDTPREAIKDKRSIQQWVKSTNYHLNKISKKLSLNCHITTYCARHSFATHAKLLGYSNEMIAEALGHEYGNKVTNIYLGNYNKFDIDNMQKEIIENISN